MKNKQMYPFQVLKEINSRRTYHIYFSSSEKMPVAHSLIDILSYSMIEDHEWAHALTDQLDNVLDLGLMQSMYFFPNRDDKSPYKEHAILKRIR